MVASQAVTQKFLFSPAESICTYPIARDDSFYAYTVGRSI